MWPLASKRDCMVDEQSPENTDFQLDAVRDPASDVPGLPLDELTQAYANLIAGGEDPYTPAPDQDELRTQVENDTDDATAVEDEDADEEAEERDLYEISPQAILEAMLFIGHPENKPLTSEEVASLMRGVRSQEIGEMVVELNRTFDQKGCPYRIESTGPGYRMVLRDEFHSLRDKFYGRTKAAKLSQAAIDVLAIVAYKQPLTREEVDELRGRPSGSLLTQLVRRELLRVERPDVKPRTPRYHTTDRFLKLFGLESPQDLPQSPD
jgi:segregation and condensation protein B